MSDIVDEFVEINRKLFKPCDEQTALAHIESLTNPGLKFMAQTLWKIEQGERLMREQSNGDE